MRRGKGSFFSYCAENRLILIVSLFISLTLCGIVFCMNRAEEKSFIMTGDKILGIKGEAYGKSVTLEVTASYGEKEISRQVTLVDEKSAAGGMSGLREDHSEKGEDVEGMLNVELDHLVRDLNREGKKESEDLILPNTYGDGINLKWNRVGSDKTFLMPLLLSPMVMVFLYRGRKDKNKKKIECFEQEIIKEIPSFSNKLILLLGSGLVYEESLKRIAFSGSGPLTRVLLDSIDKAERTNKDATLFLGDYASEKKITDLKRLVSVIMDNRRRGTDLIGKLSLEGDLLWEKRKKHAEEMGRASESKMAIPLGIMLVSLLVITAGPAMMQM